MGEAQAQQCESQARECEERSRESFDRCDTDGFLSQWASDISARKYRLQATIERNGGLSDFWGLYVGDRRVAAKIIGTQYGVCWLLRDDEADHYGRRFIPTGKRSRIQKRLGLSERKESAPAAATIKGSGTGLAGAASCYVSTYRTGDEWGQDALLRKGE